MIEAVRYPTEGVDFLFRNLKLPRKVDTFCNILQARLAPTLQRELTSHAQPLGYRLAFESDTYQLKSALQYFLARILDNVSVTDNPTKNLVNLANTCWGFLNATALALTVSRFKRRSAYLLCASSLLLTSTGWTIVSGRYAISGDQGSSRVIAFIFLYSPAYNVGYNALTYTFLVELFPFHIRAKGITIFQSFGRLAGILNTFVDPIGIAEAAMSFLAYEVVFIYFLFPETSGRSLEELAFLYEEDEAKKQRELVAQDLQEGLIGAHLRQTLFPLPHSLSPCPPVTTSRRDSTEPSGRS
ncbi:hypothetical protein EST38_g7809 [Candolleomyces aberdarensis]|uniref:Sugar transporter n=1 Tax=Candolleomyces aberdarensis TaxID=2316362 RepID=A0A4Q2DHM3_9AGAR|nr:hypothetical protein EST38_g7809 [Candolleomyces aberdarensis]